MVLNCVPSPSECSCQHRTTFSGWILYEFRHWDQGYGKLSASFYSARSQSAQRSIINKLLLQPCPLPALTPSPFLCLPSAHTFSHLHIPSPPSWSSFSCHHFFIIHSFNQPLFCCLPVITPLTIANTLFYSHHLSCRARGISYYKAITECILSSPSLSFRFLYPPLTRLSPLDLFEKSIPRHSCWIMFIFQVRNKTIFWILIQQLS